MQQLEILPKLLISYRKKKYSVNKEVLSHSLHSQHNYYVDFNSMIIITNEIFSSMQCSHHWNCYLFKTVIHSCSYLCMNQTITDSLWVSRMDKVLLKLYWCFVFRSWPCYFSRCHDSKLHYCCMSKLFKNSVSSKLCAISPLNTLSILSSMDWWENSRGWLICFAKLHCSCSTGIILIC